ncbi:MAG: protein kinase, partial [Actinobacteria bacterium]|nr:protein kinase [Actinomycetota bacterium]
MSVSWIPKIGNEFGGYRLEGLIGHGGMSIVYRAQHLKLERTVALKLLSPELSEDESFRERFTRESRLAAALDHPNVIPIYEAGDEDGVFYIAMRYVPGSNLKTLLEKEGPLDSVRVVSIIGQVASALNAAHDLKGLVHRDVKPANILVADRHGADDAPHVYLSDFGIAKQRSSNVLTRTGMFVGTADYASPEQIEGKELDRRADVYSLGCVLYECLTGNPAYEKDSEVALMYAHLLEPPPSVKEIRPDLPPEIDDILAKAMAKSRDERYDTTRDLSSALREVLAPDRVTAAGATSSPETVLASSPQPPAGVTTASPSPPLEQPGVVRPAEPGGPGATGGPGGPIDPGAQPAPGARREPGGRPG